MQLYIVSNQILDDPCLLLKPVIRKYNFSLNTGEKHPRKSIGKYRKTKPLMTAQVWVLGMVQAAFTTQKAHLMPGARKYHF